MGNFEGSEAISPLSLIDCCRNELGRLVLRFIFNKIRKRFDFHLRCDRTRTFVWSGLSLSNWNLCPALVDRLLGVFSRAPAITNFNHLINQSDLNINRKVKTLSNLAFILVLIPSNERSQALESQRAGSSFRKWNGLVIC